MNYSSTGKKLLIFKEQGIVSTYFLMHKNVGCDSYSISPKRAKILIDFLDLTI